MMNAEPGAAQAAEIFLCLMGASAIEALRLHTADRPAFEVVCWCGRSARIACSSISLAFLEGPDAARGRAGSTPATMRSGAASGSRSGCNRAIAGLHVRIPAAPGATCGGAGRSGPAARPAAVTAGAAVAGPRHRGHVYNRGRRKNSPWISRGSREITTSERGPCFWNTPGTAARRGAPAGAGGPSRGAGGAGRETRQPVVKNGRKKSTTTAGT
jgi:hypothetical protein